MSLGFKLTCSRNIVLLHSRTKSPFKWTMPSFYSEGWLFTIVLLGHHESRVVSQKMRLFVFWIKNLDYNNWGKQHLERIVDCFNHELACSYSWSWYCFHMEWSFSMLTSFLDCNLPKTDSLLQNFADTSWYNFFYVAFTKDWIRVGFNRCSLIDFYLNWLRFWMLTWIYLLLSSTSTILALINVVSLIECIGCTLASSTRSFAYFIIFRKCQQLLL